MTTSRRETEKEHGGSLPSQPGQRRGTQVEGAVPTREKAGQPCRPTQAEAHSVSLRQWHRTKTKSKPIQRRENNVTIVYWGRTQTGPETGDRTWRLGTPQDPGSQRHSSATRASQQVAYLTKNQGNNLHSEATEGVQPRINLNHLKPSANTGSEREEPKVRSKNIAGAWTTKRPEPPSENQDKGRGVPPEEGRNRGTDAAY